MTTSTFKRLSLVLFFLFLFASAFSFSYQAASADNDATTITYRRGEDDDDEDDDNDHHETREPRKTEESRPTREPRKTEESRPTREPRPTHQPRTTLTPGATSTAPRRTPTASPSQTAEATGEMKARIDSFPANLIGTWVIGGQRLTATNQTWFSQEHGNFAPGVCVEAKFRMTDRVLIKVEVKRDFVCQR